MNVDNINSANVKFQGIKLSDHTYEGTRNVVNFLRINGYTCVGKKTYNMGCSFDDIIKCANYIRNHYDFAGNEFGVMFHPWAKEAYILSHPFVEQKIIKLVREIDSKAGVNLMV